MVAGAKSNPHYKVGDVMEILQICKSKAYEIIRRLNAELQDRGKITIAGRVSRRYFHERFDV